MTPTYLTSCPACGAHLQPVVLGPDSAPWLCTICHLGFWPSELSTGARALYQPSTRGFGFGPAAAAVADQVAGDVAAAAGRRTSVLPEQLTLLPLATLQQLAVQPGISPTFAVQVEAAIKAKGG